MVKPKISATEVGWPRLHATAPPQTDPRLHGDPDQARGLAHPGIGRGGLGGCGGVGGWRQKT
eukprot:3205869-Lingulodinium_polyedra.AAC.1